MRSSRTLVRLFVVFWIFIFEFVQPGRCAGQTLQDVSADVKVRRSEPKFDRSTRTYDSVVSITNVSTTPLFSLVLVVSSITPPSVTLSNASSQDSAGNYYLNLITPAGGLLPGQTIRGVVLKFTSPQKNNDFRNRDDDRNRDDGRDRDDHDDLTFKLTVETQTEIVATSDGTSVVFKSSNGAVVLSIPLVNLDQASAGNTTTTAIHERAEICDNGTHAGIFSISSTVNTANPELEPPTSVSFSYYDSSGLKWTAQPPSGSGYYFPLATNERLLTPDGSRVLLISAEDGNTYPAFSVYDQTGNVLYQSSEPYAYVFNAQISPDGKLIAASTVLGGTGSSQNLVRVIDVTSKTFSDVPFDPRNDGVPSISYAGNDTFVIQFKGRQVTAP
jgi:hypothetical protein